MNTPHLPRGPVMADVAAYHLTEEKTTPARPCRRWRYFVPPQL